MKLLSRAAATVLAAPAHYDRQSRAMPTWKAAMGRDLPLPVALNLSRMGAPAR